MHFYETILSQEPFQPDPSATDLSFAGITTFSDEATFVYSLENKKILFAEGWLHLLGYSNEEISMQLLVSITTPDFKEFIQEMNNQALAFIFSKSEYLHSYSCTIESKKISKSGEVVPLIESVRVFRSSGGKVLDVIGTYKRNPRFPNPGNKYFQASGPGIEEFIEKMEQVASRGTLVNDQEQKILHMLANGKTMKEVAVETFVSKSKVEKMLIQLYRKFNVRNLTELIAYAHKNGLL